MSGLLKNKSNLWYLRTTETVWENCVILGLPRQYKKINVILGLPRRCGKKACPHSPKFP